MNVQSVLPVLIILPLIGFWIWMFNDFLQNDRSSKDEHLIWLVSFVFAGIFTAFYYYFTEYRNT